MQARTTHVESCAESHKSERAVRPPHHASHVLMQAMYLLEGVVPHSYGEKRVCFNAVSIEGFFLSVGTGAQGFLRLD